MDQQLLQEIDRRSPATQWEIVQVTFANADTDVEIQTGLEPINPDRIHYRVLDASGPPLVYRDTSASRIAWSRGLIRLRSAIAGLKATILLTISAQDVDVPDGGSKILARGVLPSEIAYEDEANTFSQQQTIAALLNLTGGQIQFPATQNPSANANTLDDYEEGTWTPVLGGAGGTSGQSYSLQLGYYLKIGQLVVAQFGLILTAKGTITGAVQIQGLPFTTLSSSNAFDATALRWHLMATNWVDIKTQITPNVTAADLVGSTAAGTSNVTALAAADIGNTTNMVGLIIYRANA